MVPLSPRLAALVRVGGLGVVVLRPGHRARTAASGHPGGDGARGGLLGHAVVADHRVEAAPGVGVLGGVVGLQRGRDAALVLRGKQQQDQPMRTQKDEVEADQGPDCCLSRGGAAVDLSP